MFQSGLIQILITAHRALVLVVTNHMWFITRAYYYDGKRPAQIMWLFHVLVRVIAVRFGRLVISANHGGRVDYAWFKAYIILGVHLARSASQQNPSPPPPKLTRRTRPVDSHSTQLSPSPTSLHLK